MTALLAAVGLAAIVAVSFSIVYRERDRRPPPRPRRPAWAREWPVGDVHADARSLELLRSVINEDEWRMYSDLGFLCVTGRRLRPDGTEGLPRYRYLIYPHRPLVALLPRSLSPVREYCVEFRDASTSRDGRAAFLPVGDDIIAKWMTVRSDESRMLAHANVASAGCQIPLSEIERDVRRFARWREQNDRRDEDVASAPDVVVGHLGRHADRMDRVTG